MKKRLALVFVAVALAACSSTETEHVDHGVCYQRDVQRLFGVPLNTDQQAVDAKWCGPTTTIAK